MSQFTKDEINQIQDYFNKLIVDRGDRVLAIFPYKYDNLQIIILYLPLFEELCFEVPQYKKLDKVFTIVDFRLFPELIAENDMKILSAFISDSYVVNSAYEKEFNNLIENKDKIIKSIYEKEIYDLKPICAEILNAGCKQNSANLLPFIKKITESERKALFAIVKEIQLEGNISISKMIESTKISRPVFKNLLFKLKEENIAIIDNMGVKGTYIKFLNKDILRLNE